MSTKKQQASEAANLQLAAEYFPSYSWRSRAACLFMRNLVKPVVSRVHFSSRVMRFSQLGFDTVTLALPVNPEVHISRANLGGVPGEWLATGRNIVSGRVMLYFHGGGYFFGSPRSHRALTWRLSEACHCKVLALDYRQPPDWTYPAPLDDAVAAYEGLLKRGYKPSDIVFGGDSAGGNLALVTLLKLREKGRPLPAAAVLLSPWTDLACRGNSLTTNADSEQMIPVNILHFVAAAYSKHRNEADEFISPVYADLKGLPPLFIQVSGSEVLYDDAARIAANAREAGTPCRIQVWGNMMHVFQVLAGWMPEAREAVGEIGQFVNTTLGGKAPKRKRRARLVSPV